MLHNIANNVSSIEEILEDARLGKMFILIDDENRENEGDLVIPAEKATPEVINFMATYGRGLVCLSLTGRRVEELKLSLMPRNNSSRFDTAFTVSIEARDGITTGISAADRAHTIVTAIDPARTYNDISTPGHVFPLLAKDGGVLVRAGHTEAAVDIARLAGMYPAGVICEIMKDDGSMARLPDLVQFAANHNLKIATIADLISYRLAREKMVKQVSVNHFDSSVAGSCMIYVYENIITGTEHIALVKGEISHDKPALVRMHTFNILSDALGNRAGGRDAMLEKSLRMIAENKSGVCVILREPKNNSVSEILTGNLSVDQSKRLRDYGVGAQILVDLGVHRMNLLTNTPANPVGLDGYDLIIEGYVSLKGQGSGSKSLPEPY